MGKKSKRTYYINFKKIPIRAMAVFLVICLLGVGCLYFIIDRKVRAFLLLRESSPDTASVYSDILTLTPPKDLTTFKTKLLELRYRETGHTPKYPGEFRLAPERAEIITREFIRPDAALEPSHALTFEIPSSESTRDFLLEPQKISPLGSGDIRANQYKKLEEFPKFLVDAIISIEDERYYKHWGIDLLGILRALIENLKAFKIVQGGSTITQQLAKNLFFTRKRSLVRKTQEILAALSLESRLKKEEILELYLNEVYLGQEGSVAIHGFGEAGAAFFGKKVEDLNVAEAALLAGVVQAPSSYSPRHHYSHALKRRNVVLKKMRELNLISEVVYEVARKSKPHVIAQSLHRKIAPHFMATLRSKLEEELNIDALLVSGARVYTGINLGLQACAVQALETSLSQIEKTYPSLHRASSPLEAALVTLEPYSGKVRAWVGGRDFSSNQFDHVSQAKRQIGSTIKPFLYLTALDKNLNSALVASPLTPLADQPLKIRLLSRDIWEPENYDREYRGTVTLRYALENSLNIPAVYMVQQYGLNALARTAERFHLSKTIPKVPALALGAADTTLLELTAAYGALANGGIYVAPRIFTSVIDAEGSLLASSPILEKQIAEEAPVFVLTDMLQGVIERGTGKGIRRAGYLESVAGKTGTSDESRDAWFVGFTPDLVTGVWVGFDDNAKIGLTGGTLAVPVWAEYMKCASGVQKPANFVPPNGVVYVSLDRESGRRATKACPREETVTEVFVVGTQPKEPCPLHPDVMEEGVRANEGGGNEPQKRKRGFWDMFW